MNRKGFTVVELLATFVLVAIISTLLVKLVITLKEVYVVGDMKTTLITKQSTMTDKIYKDLKNKKLTKIESCENKTNCVNFVYSDVTKVFAIDKTKKTITYDNYTIKLGKEGYFGDISIDKYNSDIGSILNLKAPLYNKLVKGDYGLNITYQLDNDIEFDDNIVFDVKNTGVKVTFDTNGGAFENDKNLLTGLEDRQETSSGYMKYSINNGTVTVTANSNYDYGYGYTTGRAILKANKTYIFKCESDGEWGQQVGTGKNMAVLSLNGRETGGVNVHVMKNNTVEFTPTESGEYWLRLDVHKANQTNHFWNISVKEVHTKQVNVGDNYGKLPTPEREGYVFKGWNGKNKFNKEKYLIWGNYRYKATSNYFYELINLNNNTTYKISVIRYNNFDGRDNGYLLISDKSTINTNYSSIAHRGDPNYSVTNYIYTTGNDGLLYIGHVNTPQANLDTIWANTDVQIEEGTTATEYEPYYVQSNTKVTQNKNHTLKAIWEKKEATFMVGRDFNAKIKQLAGDTNGAFSTENTTITSIKKYTNKPKKSILNNAEIVSTNDSKYPIYAWFSNGTIYYYTEALNPYMNSNAMDMFQYLTNAKTIDINTIDTSKVTSIQGLFNLDRNLEQLDLSNFNTSNVTNMHATFQHCSKITNLDLSSFDMSNVTYSPGTLINGMSSLTSLKTPKAYPTDSSISITLPATFKDSSNNTYTSLNNTSPKSTTLTKQS